MLNTKTFCLNKDQVYDQLHHNEFIWFMEDNSFKLCSGIYLHNAAYTYFDPYSLYWLLKYRKWVKKNIDFNNIANF